MEPSLFIATPLRDGRFHKECVAGMITAMAVFSGRVRFDTQEGFLPRARDALTHLFLESGATHMLNVDSDVGWAPHHAQQLLDTGLDFVSGCYAKRNPGRKIPAGELEGGAHVGNLLEVSHVPGGFLLLSRKAVLQMVDAYRDTCSYEQGNLGDVVGLWMPIHEGKSYYGEDISLCRRWRGIGGQIWLHLGVVLDHVGEQVFRPDPI